MQKHGNPPEELPDDVVAYGKAYEALCDGKGGPAQARCACTSGYKESVNASDVTEMFLCVPEECLCGDGSKEDIPTLVRPSNAKIIYSAQWLEKFRKS